MSNLSPRQFPDPNPFLWLADRVSSAVAGSRSRRQAQTIAAAHIGMAQAHYEGARQEREQKHPLLLLLLLLLLLSLLLRLGNKRAMKENRQRLTSRRQRLLQSIRRPALRRSNGWQTIKDHSRTHRVPLWV